MLACVTVVRRSSFAALPLALLATVAGSAAADTFAGDVTHVRSRRTADGRQIVTDATVRLGDGSERVVTQLGGHVDGKTMYVFHGPPPLEPGLRVRVDARPAGAMSPRWIVEDVDVLAGPGGLPYVRTPAKKSGKPLYWAKSCVQVSWAQEGTRAIAGDGERAVIEQALAAWNGGVGSCSYLNLVGMGPVEHEVGEDQINLVKFRDDTWCRPAVDGNEARCHSPNAAGITTVIYVDAPDDPRDGEIVDADIELNGVDFAIATGGQTLSQASCQADLANTLVHELGHLLGLDHSCRKGGDPPRVDATGAPVPFCIDTTDPTILEATMYPEQQCGETKKASLSPDDTGAICAIYPSSDDPGECGPPDPLSGGCCDAGGAGGPSALLGLVTLGVLLSRRRSPRD